MIKNKDKVSNKSFGIVFFVFFLILSIFSFKNDYNLTLVLFLISLIFLILGLKNSKLLSPLNNYWIKFGYLLGKIISPIIMAIIYFSIVYITKIILILINKNILNLKINKNIKSYWIKRNEEELNMENQF